jgi:predicted ATPase
MNLFKCPKPEPCTSRGSMVSLESDGTLRAAPAVASAGQRLKLQTDYSQAMMWSKGFGSEEAGAAFARARELTAGTDNSAERFVIYFAQFLGSALRGELAIARKTAEAFRREAEREGRATERVVGLRLLGLSCLFQGDLIEAQAHFEEALRTYDPQRDRGAKFRFGQDAAASASTYLAFTDWLLGDVGDTRARMEEGLARAVESNHPGTQANINYFTATFEIVRGDVDAARRAAETVVELAREHGLGQYAVWGALPSAWARTRFGDREASVAELREALEAYSRQGNKTRPPLYQGLLAEIEAEGEDVEHALTRIDEALGLAQQTGEHWTDAFLHRIRGEILLKHDPANTAPAEEDFLTAIAVAQQQKAKSFELRAAMSMARLWRDQGKPQQARELLAPVYGWFTEGFDTLDLKDAKALLVELSS